MSPSISKFLWFFLLMHSIGKIKLRLSWRRIFLVQHRGVKNYQTSCRWKKNLNTFVISIGFDLTNFVFNPSKNLDINIDQLWQCIAVIQSPLLLDKQNKFFQSVHLQSISISYYFTIYTTHHTKKKHHRFSIYELLLLYKPVKMSCGLNFYSQLKHIHTHGAISCFLFKTEERLIFISVESPSLTTILHFFCVALNKKISFSISII